MTVLVYRFNLEQALSLLRKERGGPARLHLPCGKISLKLGGICCVRGKRAVASSLPYASQRSPPSASGHKTSFPKKVKAFSPSAETQQVKQTSWLRGNRSFAKSWVEPVAFVGYGYSSSPLARSRKGHHRSPYKGDRRPARKGTIL